MRPADFQSAANATLRLNRIAARGLSPSARTRNAMRGALAKTQYVAGSGPINRLTVNDGFDQAADVV